MLARASVFPGSVWTDERQRPLHMPLFRPGPLRARVRHRHPEAGEEERQLPAGLLAVAAAVESVQKSLGAVLSPQAEERRGERGRMDGWKEGRVEKQRKRRADGLTAGSRPGQREGGRSPHRMCCAITVRAQICEHNMERQRNALVPLLDYI